MPLCGNTAEARLIRTSPRGLRSRLTFAPSQASSRKRIGIPAVFGSVLFYKKRQIQIAHFCRNREIAFALFHRNRHIRPPSPESASRLKLPVLCTKGAREGASYLKAATLHAKEAPAAAQRQHAGRAGALRPKMGWNEPVPNQPIPCGGR